MANALAGIEAGATQVQGTINGYGERTGNCNLTSVIPNLQLKMGKACLPVESLPKLKELSHFVDEIANIRPDPRQPWVGASAFAHKGGMHVHAIAGKVENVYVAGGISIQFVRSTTLLELLFPYIITV